MIDANEEWNERSSKIRGFANNLGLFNVARETHGNTLPPTFPEPGRTTDFMLDSYSVVQSIEAMGSVPFLKTTLGDYRGQYVDLKIQELLGIGKVDSSSAHGRKLQYSMRSGMKGHQK